MNKPTKAAVPPPNYTQTPNILYTLMPSMTDSELRVTLAICRQTFGWHRERAKLSLGTLVKATGLSKQGVVDGIAQGEARGTIGREPLDPDNPRRGFHYFLLVNEVDQPEEVLVNVVDKASQPTGQALVNVVDNIKERKERVKENGVRARTEDGETATDAVLRIAIEAGLTTKQRNQVATALEGHGLTFQQTRALWDACKPADNPAAAFISAATTNGGRPFDFARSNGRPARPATRTRVDEDGRTWTWQQGDGWIVNA